MKWVHVNELPPIGEDVYGYNSHYDIHYGLVYIDDDGNWRDQNGSLNAGYDYSPNFWLRFILPDPPRKVGK